jgi:hypothetical protein
LNLQSEGQRVHARVSACRRAASAVIRTDTGDSVQVVKDRRVELRAVTRKGRCRRINERRFIRRRTELDGRLPGPGDHESMGSALARLEREYGAAAADNAEQRRPTMRGFKVAPIEPRPSDQLSLGNICSWCKIDEK